MTATQIAMATGGTQMALPEKSFDAPLPLEMVACKTAEPVLETGEASTEYDPVLVNGSSSRNTNGLTGAIFDEVKACVSPK